MGSASSLCCSDHQLFNRPDYFCSSGSDNCCIIWGKSSSPSQPTAIFYPSDAIGLLRSDYSLFSVAALAAYFYPNRVAVAGPYPRLCELACLYPGLDHGCAASAPVFPAHSKKLKWRGEPPLVIASTDQLSTVGEWNHLFGAQYNRT